LGNKRCTRPGTQQNPPEALFLLNTQLQKEKINNLHSAAWLQVVSDNRIHPPPHQQPFRPE
jgi:hypothetical protein